MVVAGEASGDEHAAAALREVRRLRDGVEAWGMGGPALAAAGLRLEVDLRATTTMGVLEVGSRLPAIAGAFVTLLAVAARRRPEAALLVDLPDFNLPLAAALGRLGVPAVGYVAPQTWAWRAGRTRLVARHFARVACILPFEAPLLERAGAHASFVGHPSLEAPRLDRAAIRVELGLDPSASVLALLPGSRPGERVRLLPPMLEAARAVRRGSEVAVVLAAAPSLPRPRAPRWVRVVTAEDGLPPGRACLAAADAALVTSGTATVEAALAGVPQVVVYRMAPASALAARLLVRGRFFAMPNVLLGRRAVPELFQGAATAEAMARHALQLLRDGPEARAQRAAAAQVRRALGNPGAARRTAELVAEVARW